VMNNVFLLIFFLFDSKATWPILRFLPQAFGNHQNLRIHSANHVYRISLQPLRRRLMSVVGDTVSAIYNVLSAADEMCSIIRL